MEAHLLWNVRHKMQPPLTGIVVHFLTSPIEWGFELGFS